MHVDLGAMLQTACAETDGYLTIASSLLAGLPDLANPEDSFQPWDAPDSSQQPAAEPLALLLPSYLRDRADNPAGSERLPTPATEGLPLDDSSPLRTNIPCLQNAAMVDVGASNDAGCNSWLHMPSDDEDMPHLQQHHLSSQTRAVAKMMWSIVQKSFHCLDLPEQGSLSGTATMADRASPPSKSGGVLLCCMRTMSHSLTRGKTLQPLKLRVQVGCWHLWQCRCNKYHTACQV